MELSGSGHEGSGTAASCRRWELGESISPKRGAVTRGIRVTRESEEVLKPVSGSPPELANGCECSTAFSACFIAIFIYLAASSEAHLVAIRAMARGVPVTAAMLTQIRIAHTG
jgi:hypothetical protein